MLHPTLIFLVCFVVLGFCLSCRRIWRREKHRTRAAVVCPSLVARQGAIVVVLHHQGHPEQLQRCARLYRRLMFRASCPTRVFVAVYQELETPRADVRNLLIGEGAHLRVISVPRQPKGSHGANIVGIMHSCTNRLLHGEGTTMLLDNEVVPSDGWDERVLDELRDAEKKHRHAVLTAMEGPDGAMRFPTWQPWGKTVAVHGRIFPQGQTEGTASPVRLATPMVCAARSRMWRQSVPVTHSCVALALSA